MNVSMNHPGSFHKAAGSILILLSVTFPVRARPDAPAAGVLRPLITAPRVRQAPVVDGTPDDPAWKYAPAGNHFVLLGTDRPAAEQTRFRVVHDGRNLYFCIVCAESALVPAEQRAEQVRRTARKHDGNVFADDVVEVFLGLPDSRSYAHFAVNAAGSRYEARDRDASWNTAWKAAARLDNGRWMVEMAVPLHSVPGREPHPGDLLVFNVAREEKPRSELSSWARLQEKFHEPEHFGRLRLSPGDAPAVVLEETGEDAGTWWGVVRAGSRRKGNLLVRILTAKGRLLGENTLSWPANGFTHKRLQAAVGRTRFVVLEAREKERPVFRTPRMRLHSGGMAEYRAEFAGAGTVTVFVDGRAVLRSDARGRVNGRFSLPRGVHLIVAAFAGPGSASGRLYSGNFPLPLDASWRRHDGVLPEAPGTAAGVIARWPPADSAAVGRNGAMFAKVIVVGGASPTPLAPNCSLAQLPHGTPELMYPTLDPPPPGVPGPYTAVVYLPPGFVFHAADGRAGQRFDEVVVRKGPAGSTVRLETSFPGRSGFEISARFSDAAGALTGYIPAVAFGGTHDWAVRSVRVKAPPGSVGVRPLFIKWQKRGAVGECWIDDVEVRDVETGRTLLRRTFEEADWTKRPYVRSLPGGGHAACIRGTKDKTARQQALWLVDGTIPVRPGSTLEFRCRARCRDVHSVTAPTHAALVVESRARPGTEAAGWISYEAGNGLVVQHPRRFTLRTLPPLRGVRPKRIRIVPCYYSDRFEEPASRALAANIDKAGITGIYGHRNTMVGRYVRSRLHWIMSLPWHEFAADRLGFAAGEVPQDIEQVDYHGRRREGRACPTWLLSSEGRARFRFLGDWIAERIRAEGRYDEIDWDYETPVVDPPTFCFCPRCISAFAARIGADPETLDAALILKKYRDQWTAFRCRQNADIAGLLAAQIHRVAPGVEFSVYSGHQNRRTREHYGVDWNMMAEVVDLGIAGYNAPPEQARVTAAALAAKGKRFMGGEMYLLSITAPRGTWHPETWKVRLVRQTVESGGLGCLIWWLPVMDGGAFFETSRAAALLAGIEDFVTGGRRADGSIPVLRGRSEDVVVLQREGRRCLLLFNRSQQPAAFELDVRGRFVEMLDTGRPGDAMPRRVIVPPRDVRAFVETGRQAAAD